jgi:hypothetical protein
MFHEIVLDALAMRSSSSHATSVVTIEDAGKFKGTYQAAF